MPVVFRFEGYKFFLYANEGDPREPVHIHVRSGDREAKFWLTPEIRIAYNDGFDARSQRWLIKIIGGNSERIMRAWNEFFT